MMSAPITFSVFTKPWKTQSINELGEHISGIGFDGIEFPLRDGYQAEPKDADISLPGLAKKLGTYGLKITSVASITDEKVFVGCAAAGIPVIRIMVGHNLKINFYEEMIEKQKELEKVLPFCEKYNVKVAVQHHYGPGINNSMELKWLVERFNPKHIGAIWDTAHSGLAGEEPEQSLDILWSHLCMVNFKSACYRQISKPGAAKAVFERFFTTGNNGLCSWERTADYLKVKGYNGVVCLTAEYTEEDKFNSYIVEDLRLAKSLLLDPIFEKAKV